MFMRNDVTSWDGPPPVRAAGRRGGAGRGASALGGSPGPGPGGGGHPAWAGSAAGAGGGGGGEESVRVWMIVPLKVGGSKMAAQRRGSVNVLVPPPKDSLEAMATLFFSSRSVSTWKSSSAPCRS